MSVMHIIMFSQSIAGGAHFLANLTRVRHVKMAFQVSFHVPLLCHQLSTGRTLELCNPVNQHF